MQFVAYGFDAERLGFAEENLRHEFEEAETTIKAVFTNGARLTVVWPEQSDRQGDEALQDDTPFFFVEFDNHAQPRTPAAVRKAFPAVGAVPMLTPLERREALLEPTTVRRAIGGRPSSRHFRNELNPFDARRVHIVLRSRQ